MSGKELDRGYTIRLPKELRQAVRIAAAHQAITGAELIRRAILDYLKRLNRSFLLEQF